MPRGRWITTAAALAALIAPAPAVADTFADSSFSGGTHGSTWINESGRLQLEPALAETFAADGLGSLVETVYGPGGETTLGAGEVTIDGASVGSAGSTGPGRVIEFRARFSGDPNQHIGFGDDFTLGPWAMFSTRGGNDGLWARTRSGTGETSVNTQVPLVDPFDAHVFRIEWTATDVRFFVDGQAVDVPTDAVPIAGEMRALASDASAAGGAVTVDWVTATPTEGTFESAKFNVNDVRARWDALTATGGAGVSFETRSGNAPDALSPYEPVGPGGAIASPAGRYIQYRATLTTGGLPISPALSGVEFAYAVDTAAPAVTLGAVAVNGTTASVSFSRAAADVARFECSLDGGAFATCTSPVALTALAPGAHTIAVRALDTVGNTGAPASQTFTIASPPTGDDPTPSGNPPAGDRTAPLIKLGARRITAGRRAALRLTCPSGELRCTVDVRLTFGKRSAGRARITIAGGKTRTVRVKLTKSARDRLAERGKLNVMAAISTTDAAGNRRPLTANLTLRAR